MAGQEKPAASLICRTRTRMSDYRGQELRHLLPVAENP